MDVVTAMPQGRSGPSFLIAYKLSCQTIGVGLSCEYVADVPQCWPLYNVTLRLTMTSLDAKTIAGESRDHNSQFFGYSELSETGLWEASPGSPTTCLINAVVSMGRRNTQVNFSHL